ncbi:MAG: TonB-dependent receptor [Pseudomonadota bacterium]
MKYQYFLALSLPIVVTAWAGSAAAQSRAAPTDEIIVVADPAGLLEDRPTDVVFGLDRAAFDTPRSVSIISDTTVQRYAIEDIDDFITIAPGTFGGSFFGVPGSISIRGGISESYFRGFRRVINNGLFPTPVGAAERIEIVRGPAPAVYGAARIGGFLNFHPQSAPLGGEGPTGRIAYTGGSFNKNVVSAAGETPFAVAGRATAVAAFVEYENSGDFYTGRDPKHLLIQAEAAHDLGGGARLTVGGMLFNAEGYEQTTGWNRLTQELIDDGVYVTGRDTDLVDVNGDGRLQPDEVAAVISPFELRPFIDFGPPGPFSPVLALDEGVGRAQLSRRDVLTSDFALTEADTFVLYADLSKEIAGGEATVSAFYDSVDGAINTAHGFAARHDMDVFEARGSYKRAFVVAPAVALDLNFTASYRRYDADLQEHFLSGLVLFDRVDLTRGATGADTFATPITDPGVVPWDTDIASDWSDVGGGVIADLQLGERVSILAGVRYDRYKAEARDVGAVIFGPSAGEGRQDDISYSVSTTIAVADGVNVYATYANAAEPLYNSNGGISPGFAGADDFLFASELIETGLKFRLLDGRLNGALAFYRQERSRVDQFQNVDLETGRGVEFDARFLMTDNWTITAAATVQRFELGDPGACGSFNGGFLNIPVDHPTARNSEGVLLNVETGSGGGFAALNASCLPELQGGYEREQIPNAVVSSFVTYTSDETPAGLTWGGTLGATYVGETGGALVTSVTLPDYATVRASAFAAYGRWSLTALVDNALDATYFQPLQDVNAEISALPGRGRYFELTAAVTF